MAEGSMPYIPPLGNRDASQGGGTVLLVVIGVTVVIYLFVHMQKAFRRHAEARVRRKPSLTKVKAREQTKFVDTHVEVTNGVNGTQGLPTGLRLTVEFPQHEKSYAATVINVSDESFVVTLPPAKAGLQPFSPSTGDEAKFFGARDNRHFTFMTTVLQVFSGGLRACSFRHTPNVEVSNRRVHRRVSGDIPVLFSAIPQRLITAATIPASDLLHQVPCDIPGLMQDISTGGCALRTRSPLHFEAGDLVLVNACFPGSDEEFVQLAGITGVHNLQSAEGGGALLNLEFLASSEKVFELISQYVSQQLEDEIVA